MKHISHIVCAIVYSFCVLGVLSEDLDNISLDENPGTEDGTPTRMFEDEEEETTEVAQASWAKNGDKITGGQQHLAKGEGLIGTLPTKEKAPGFALRFRAHGTGRLIVTFQAQTVFGRTVPLNGTGLKMSQPLSFDLQKQDRPYCIYGAVAPMGAKSCMVRLSTSSEMEVSGLELVTLKEKRKPITEINRSQKTLPAGYFMARELPIKAGEVDLASRAEYLSEKGFSARTRQAVDGSFGTKDGPFTLRFPEPVAIDELRLTLPQGDVFVYADLDGDGYCEKPVVEVTGDPVFGTWSDMPQYVWYVKRFEKSLKVHALYVPGGAWEFRTIGAAAEAAKLPQAQPLPKRTALAFGAEKKDPVPKENDRLFFGFTLEPWMFGSQEAFGKFYETDKMQPLAEWPSWKKVLKDFEFYGANFTLLFPPATGVIPPKCAIPRRGDYASPVMWPSEVWYISQPTEVLKEFHASCHEHGISSFVIPRDWSFVEEPTVRPKQVIFAQEIAQRDADGVPACLDEHIFGFGLWKTEDTPEYRKLYLEKVAKEAAWMAEIKADTEKTNPNALTFGGYGGCDFQKERYRCVSGCDFWGFEGRVDVIGGDGTYYGVGDGPFGTYAPGVETAVQVSCTPKRMSMATLNCNWGTHWEEDQKRLKNPLVYDDYPSTAFKAGPLMSFFHKGQYAQFWRYNYIFENGGPACRAAAAAAGRLTKILSAWGGKGASIPKDVLILRSRTSEDWWGIKERAKAGKDASAAQVEAIELGFTQFFWAAARLCEKAVPFEIYQMQRPETWAKIAKDYKVILLPFAYSVSEAEAAALKAAADAGVKILTIGTVPFGVADGTGAVRAKPLDTVPVERFAFDPLKDKATRRLADDFNAFLAAALAKRGGVSQSLGVEPDHDVQAYRLDAKDGSALVLVVNWSERDTVADLKVKLPFASGSLEVATEDKLYDAPFATDLRLDLPREAVRLLRFSKK